MTEPLKLLLVEPNGHSAANLFSVLSPPHTVTVATTAASAKQAIESTTLAFDAVLLGVTDAHDSLPSTLCDVVAHKLPVVLLAPSHDLAFSMMAATSCAQIAVFKRAPREAILFAIKFAVLKATMQTTGEMTARLESLSEAILAIEARGDKHEQATELRFTRIADQIVEIATEAQADICRFTPAHHDKLRALEQKVLALSEIHVHSRREAERMAELAHVAKKGMIPYALSGGIVIISIVFKWLASIVDPTRTNK